MDATLRERVWQRAHGRCEYCLLKQEHETSQSFHIEHVIARQHGGTDDVENLALACSRCNAYKGPNLTSRDPDTGLVEMLFHPRQQSWAAHFRLDGALVLGLTPIGRTTVWLLQMNSPRRVQLRELLIEDGDWD